MLRWLYLAFVTLLALTAMTRQKNVSIDLFKIKKSALSLGLAIGLTLLSGCQTLSSLFPEDEEKNGNHRASRAATGNRRHPRIRSA